MASNIPTRRATRARPTVLDENSHAVRPSAPSRIKAGVTATVDSAPVAKTKASSSRVASGQAPIQEATIQGKRKRDALNEVTNNKGKAALRVTGKETTAPSLAKPSTAVARPARAPVAVPAVRHRKTRSSTTTNKEPAVEDDAMVVDPPVHAARRVANRGAPNNTTTAQTTIRVTSKKSVTTVARTSRTRAQHVIEDEDLRVHKKRRTSSEPGDVNVIDEETEDIFRAEYLAKVEPEEITGWEDLDRDDDEDPLMVNEYVADIFDYLFEIEKMTMPKPNYITMQKELTWKMRGILVDWLVDVHSSFRQLPETLFLAVNIMDRFLSSRVVSLSKVQLVGVACLYVAAKYEEICAPSVKNMAKATDSAYTEAEILEAEKYVLRTIDWNLSYSSPITFLRRASKADGYDVQNRTIAKYLAEIACVEWRLLSHPPSLVSAAAIWLARLVLDKPDWNVTLAHYAGYSEKALLPTANIMINYILRSGTQDQEEHDKFFKKYAGRKFMKASLYVREWALSRWSSGSVVVLAEELDALKAAAETPDQIQQ